MLTFSLAFLQKIILQLIIYSVQESILTWDLMYSPSEIWSKILECLQDKHVIKYWSKAGRTIGDSFTVEEVGPNYVVVVAESTGTQQRIPRSDFLKVIRVWEAYLAGRVKRHEIRDITRFSSYIISILHACENHIK